MNSRFPGSPNLGSADNAILLKSDSVINNSRQFADFSYSGDILRPPYEPKDLIALIERNDSLKQNIEALAVNTASFGHTIRYQDDFDFSRASPETRARAEREWDLLTRLYKNVNPLSGFSSLIYKAAYDMYSFGWGMLEVIRNASGSVAALEYCRACNFRISGDSRDTVPVLVWQDTDSGFEQVSCSVRFKKFVQIVGGSRVFFKEFGDPRTMSCITGLYGDDIPPSERASEIAYFSVHSSYSDYGVPPWINTAVSASGNILSELLNYKYFKDGRILPLAILVSGGQLTQSSIQAISESKGVDNAYKALILEASPFEDSDSILSKDSASRVNVDIKQLADSSNSDSLFRLYQLDGREKIRDSMRLPPIYTGASSDYNRATADTARAVAEEQIFMPERKRICDIFNKIINNELAVRFCELALKGPDLSDFSQKADIISALNSAGAVTPNMLLPLVEKILGRDIELWDDSLGNIPFELLKLRLKDLS